MPAPFPRSANTAYWIAIGGAAAGIVVVPLALMAWARTPYATGQNEAVPQPIKFDHRHHTRDDGIDCAYCHAGSTRGKTAGLPSSALCMGCHAQVWTDSPELAAVRESVLEDRPIHWNRVTRVADFVFFDHSAHTQHGVGCVTCHGRVDRMGQVFQAEPMTMSFCLDCHREPEEHLRPREVVTDMEWRSDGSPKELGATLRASYGVRSLTDCSICHR